MYIIKTRLWFGLVPPGLFDTMEPWMSGLNWLTNRHTKKEGVTNCHLF